MPSITALATSAHSSTDLSNPFGSEPSNFKQIKSACVLASTYLAHSTGQLATSLYNSLYESVQLSG